MNDEPKQGDKVIDQVTGAVGAIMGASRPLKFQIPETTEVEAYAVQFPDGSIEVRTKNQLEIVPPAKEEKTEGEG